MASFICTRCGKCCISLGRHIRIERSLSPVQHYVRNAISNDVTLVTIHPDRRALFSGTPDPGWCPFLRRDAGGVFVCTIHENRPAVCRDFRCRTMVITGKEGTEVGHVTGTASLTTEDPVLKALWTDLKRRMPGSGPAWFREMQRELSNHGYALDILS
ncbi:MAG: YkgJ family cysteine cluster protein [Methanomicrobiales archaeon]|nr:YkgJ family cysteine cluster protein [Methanomicrobiales archaeon]NYT20969.1 YkgJ family cysteine cluster protein [Methanomicrobiales archaeon]